MSAQKHEQLIVLTGGVPFPVTVTAVLPLQASAFPLQCSVLLLAMTSAQCATAGYDFSTVCYCWL